MYPHPRRYLWYLAALVLLLFALPNPVAAAHLAAHCATWAGRGVHALWKLAGAL